MSATHSRVEGSESGFEWIQELQERLDATPDSPAKELADELVAAVLALYGEGLGRIVQRLGTDALVLTEEPLISTLLLIHDLHPVSLLDRVQQALESVRPYMESHGGNVELLSLEQGVARIHLRGSCSDCSASAVTLELAIKQALEQSAPDLEGLEVEGMGPQAVTGAALPMASSELPVLMSTGTPAWFEVPVLGDLADGGMASVSVEGRPLVVANLDGTLLAYRDACAGCGAPLHDGALHGVSLACGHCGRSFLLPRAGRSSDEPQVQLEPVPLLRESGRVKVALNV
ncbi:MAG TPA: NifU family protein [Solirubrobacteraceae bacterium]|jgi:Fe-S cluster biogenesis protein NfuA/nitrite reductase/ring-hydroxylating ferredoxin subunit|nr:NifU family protein [Solirubrobacteraceae bacterium]